MNTQVNERRVAVVTGGSRASAAPWRVGSPGTGKRWWSATPATRPRRPAPSKASAPPAAFSTSVTRLALPTYAGYAASKAAVEAISLILSRELRGRDITVNAVAPGPTATALFLDGKDDQTIERMAKLNPMERLGTPDDIAEVVSFLAGPGRWLNGQTLYANGGAA